eukprot:scaffold272786_cov27-Tisochrysis_lutea.AAC.3
MCAVGQARAPPDANRAEMPQPVDCALGAPMSRRHASPSARSTGPRKSFTVASDNSEREMHMPAGANRAQGRWTLAARRYWNLRAASGKPPLGHL